MTLPDLSVLKKLAEARLISLLETESGDKDVIIDSRIIRLFDFVANFQTLKFYACEVYLEQEGIYGDVTIEVLDLELIPMDKDLLSFEVPAIFPSYFAHRDRSWIKSIAQSLVSSQSLFGEFNRVYTIGDYSKKIWNLAEVLAKNVDSDPNVMADVSATKLDTLIMIDRGKRGLYFTSINSSYVSRNHRRYIWYRKRSVWLHCYLVLGPSSNVGKGSIKMLLNSSDQIFANIRDSHITTVFGIIRERAKEIQSGYDKRHDYKSVSGLKDFVRNEFKDLQSQHKSLTGHLSLCENLMTTKTKENLEYLLTQESYMLAGTNEKECLDFIETCIIDKDITSALRLMCLYSVTHDGLPSAQYHSLWLQFLQSHGYDKLVSTQYVLKKSGLFTEQTTKKNKFKAICKKLGLIPKTPTEVDLSKPKSMAYIHGGQYAPMSCKLIEHVLTFPNSFRDDDDIGKILNCDCSCIINASTISANRQTPIVMVYFIGGCTYSEIAALRFLGKQLNTEFLIATTSVTNSERLLKDVINSA
ncbi:Vacuolar protein sorting-associated protein 33B [Trichoplax sp. H2]|nr:Vacuolar protein sorting-associated protein 33B [Trichoplax sp. H2]|eukprot:RDD39049.1 Vacuolar protein sorting-associated protein 33B [Trichoplax sp. H2]